MKLSLFAAALALIAGCRSPSPTCITIDSDTVELKPGETGVLLLRENVTTGYSWNVAVEGERVTAEIEHLGPPKTKEPLCGAPGSAKVTVTALPGFDGEATVMLKYMRPWNGDTAKTKAIKVVSAK